MRVERFRGASPDMLQDLCLSRSTPCRLPSVLARVGSDELGTHTPPAAAEFISDAESVDEVLRAVDDAAAARPIRPGKRQRYLMHDTNIPKISLNSAGIPTIPEPRRQVSTSTHPPLD
jgi:hypothetical protein